MMQSTQREEPDFQRGASGRAQERDDQPQDVPDYSDDRSHQLQHAIIMPESAGGYVLWTLKQPRRELLRTTVFKT
jgi:hypothetical protein